MPLIYPAKTSFNSGEVSPSIWARTDIDKNKSSLRTARNFIVHSQGGASNRCGWENIHSTKYANSLSISQEFIFNQTQAYTLEFGHYYVRFYTDGAQITNGGQAYEIATPYAVSDLLLLRFESSADVIVITHPSIQQRTLTRFGTTSWVLDVIDYEDGPFMVENTDETTSLTVSAVTGSSVTLTVSSVVDTTRNLLIHFDGANGSTNITDDVGNIVTVSGDAQISTAQSKFGGSSGLFDGTGDYISVPDSSSWSFGSGDFTVDCWVYFNSFSGTPAIFAQGFSGGTDLFYLQVGTTTLQCVATVSSAVKLNLSASHGMTTSGWYHIAVVGGWAGTPSNVAVTVNGTSIVSGAITGGSMPNASGNLYIGSIDGSTQSLNGYIDEFSISKGTARWTTNFTPPTSAYSIISPGNYTFSPLQVGGLFKLRHYIGGQTTSQAFTGTGTTTGIKCFTTWRIITHGTWTGKFKIQKSTDGGTTYTDLRQFSSADDFNANTSGTEDIETNPNPFLVRVNFYSFTSGTANIDLTTDPFYQEGIVKVTAFVSTTSLTTRVLTEVGSTLATSSWFEGSWSDYRGWPAVARFNQDRLVYASTYSEPQTEWMTKTGDYYSFIRHQILLDTDAISVPLPSRQLNAINGLVAFKRLLSFTSSAIWSVGPVTGSVLTPTSFTQDIEEYSGAANVPPVVLGTEAFFVEFGGEVIRNIGYQLANDGFIGSETNILAKHLFEGYTITKMAFQRKPNSILWCLRSDGVLLALTYLKEQEVVAWTHHDTDGTVESICVIPGDDSDELWATILRDNGRYMERMKGRRQHDITGHVFLDSFVTVNNNTGVISGLTNLASEVVGVMGDDVYLGTYTVSAGGTFAISTLSAVTYIGLPYNSDLETLNIDIPLPNGSIQGGMVKIGEITFRLINTRSGYVGPNSSILYEAFTYAELNKANFAQNRVALGVTEAFTGDIRVPLGGSYEKGGHIFFRQSKPLPVTIAGLIPEVSLGDKVGG